MAYKRWRFEEVTEGCLKVMKEVRVLGRMKKFGLSKCRGVFSNV